MRRVWPTLLLIPSVAMGASVCPEGYSALNQNPFVAIAAQCAENQTDLGPFSAGCSGERTICMPEVTCHGLSAIRTSSGVRVPLYMERYTTPAINVALDSGGRCYANLLPGSASGTLNVLFEDNVYHAVALRRCMELDFDATPIPGTPAAYAVSWTAQVKGVGVTGISHCSSTLGDIGTLKSELSISETVGENHYCWCRVLSPSSSTWTFAVSFESGSCNESCVQECANMFASNSTFRRTLMSAMTM